MRKGLKIHKKDMLGRSSSSGESSKSKSEYRNENNVETINPLHVKKK
jgi:hypothetical protein